MTTGVKAAAIAAALGGRSPGARSPTRRSGSRERLWASSRPSRPDSPHSWAARRSRARAEPALGRPSAPSCGTRWLIPDQWA
jgi:hypothetical protein